MKTKLTICFILIANLLHKCSSSVIEGNSTFSSSRDDLKPINPSDCPISEDTYRGNISNLPDYQKWQQEQDDRDLPFQCMRRYFHEPSQKYDLQFIEKSIDEKAANSSYMANIVNPWNDEISTFSAENAHLMRKTAGRKFNEQHCSEHLNAMISILDELKYITQAKRQPNNTSLILDESHIRLARVLDSFGRYEPSLIAGRHLFMGSYTQCHGTYMILDKQSQTNTMVAARYCTAQLKIDNHLNEQLVRRKKFPHEMRLNIKVGICIPETCHTISFDKHKQAIQKLVDTSFQLPSEYYIEQHPQVESIFCGVDEDSEAAKIPFSGKLLICFLICWLSVVTYSTYKENINCGCNAEYEQPSELEPSQWLDRVYYSMSMQASWDHFITVSAETDYKRRVDLAVLSSTKVMAPVIVVLSHSFEFQFFSIADMSKSMFVADTNPIVYLVTSIHFRIDCLFILSGLFIVYFAMKIFTRMYNIDRNSSLDSKTSPLHDMTLFIKIWPQIFAARYMRLIPLYFLVVWFKKSLFSKLGSGPLWDYGFNNRTMMGACHQESWFAPLTYENAFKDLVPQCEPQAWFLANEVFFNIYLTPIIALTIIRPKIAAIIGILASVASFIAMFYGVIVIPPRLLISLQELRGYSFSGNLLDYSYLYVAPYYHCFAFLVGIYCGYVLHEFNENPNKKWPKWMVGRFSDLCVTLILLSIIPSIFVPYQRDTFPKFLYFFLNTVGRITLVMACGLVFIRATTCWQDTFLMKFGSAKCWQILSKLSYGIFLVHFDILTYERLTRPSVEYYSGIHMFFVLGSHLFYSIVVGLFFHLIFESPIDRLFKSFLFKARNNHKDIKPCIANNPMKVMNPGESQL